MPYYIVKQCEDGKHKGYNEVKSKIEKNDDWEGTPEEAHKLALKEVYKKYKEKKDAFLNKYTDNGKITAMYNMVKTILPSEDYNMINEHMDYNEKQKYKFHFKNGCFKFLK